MKLPHAAILALSLVATAFLFPAADAAKPWACSNVVTPSCGHTVCFAGSPTQVPHCEDVTITTSKISYCTEGNAPCRGGDLACVTSAGHAVACAPDPCYTTQCFTSDSKCINNCNPLVGVCARSLGESCYGNGFVCVGFSYEVPFCVPGPCETPWFGCAMQAHSASCTEVAGVGFAGAVCTVDGKQVGPVATCDACNPLVVVRCTETTDGAPIACQGIQINME
jgi:hypothetical protein